MSDDIRALTARLAADPASLVFLDLAEALRRRRQTEAAYKVARTGAARYPELADVHDLLGRILSDRGELDRAFEAWATAVQLEPHRASAHKGLGFLYYRAGDTAAALRHLEWAAEADPADPSMAGVLDRVRRSLRGGAADEAIGSGMGDPGMGDPGMGDPGVSDPGVSDPGVSDPIATGPSGPRDDPEPAERPRELFAGFEGTEEGLLLLDQHGLRVGGGLRSPEGIDVGDAVAAHLAGVSKEAARAARLLGLGPWQSVAVESPDGHLHLGSPTEQTVLLAVRPPSWPAGRVALLAERANRAARTWLGGQG